MNKFSLDYSKLEQSLTKKKYFLLEDVKDRLQKVAWDVVRFRDNEDTEMLWKIEDSPEGPVIVALYDEDTGKLKAESKGEWSVVKEASRLHVFYKEAHVSVLDSNNTGIPEDELGIVSRWLPAKLASDEEFQSYVLSMAGKNGVSWVQSNHPELRKIAEKALTLVGGYKDVERKDLSEIAEGIKNA